MGDFMRNKTPVTALRSSSIAHLSMLDEPGSIDESSGLLNNYEGFAELAGFSPDKLELLKAKDEPMRELLKTWPDVWAAREKQVPTIGNLLEYLNQLGRSDVAEKIEKSVCLDVKAYQEIVTSNRPTEPIKDQSLTYEEEEMSSICLKRNGEQQFYDGYVGNDEKDDSRALKIIQSLEKAWNITLFFTPRDMPPGVPLYPAQVYIIEKRCSYLLCFITKDFEKSPSCQFIIRYVNHLSPDGVKKKMIPMIIDSQAQVPKIMQPLKHIDFSDSEVEQYSQHKHWNQLKEALKPVDHSKTLRKLRKSVSFPIGFVQPQTYRRSISEQTEQSKRSDPVCNPRSSLEMCQEERKNEVERIVSTPSDDSQAKSDELSQAADTQIYLRSPESGQQGMARTHLDLNPPECGTACQRTCTRWTDGVKKKMIPMIIDSQAQVPKIMQPLKHIDFSDSEVEQYSQHKHWNQLKEALKPVDHSKTLRKLRKSVSFPIGFVQLQTYRRSISEQTEQSKRSDPVCNPRSSLEMCQEERKDEVERIVSTPSDDSQTKSDELSQAADTQIYLRSPES